jgi:hypothetical protein
VQRRQHVDVVVDDQQGLRRLGGRVVAGRQAARRRRHLPQLQRGRARLK